MIIIIIVWGGVHGSWLPASMVPGLHVGPPCCIGPWPIWQCRYTLANIVPMWQMPSCFGHKIDK